MVSLLSVLALTLAVPALHSQNQLTLKPFEERVEKYVELHRHAQSGVPKARVTPDPAELVRQQQALAVRIRAARPNAVQGELFLPEVRQVFLQVIKQELSGPKGAATRALIMDEGNPKPGSSPARMPIAVNAPYPAGAPLSTVPPSLLSRFPALPEELDYRFVGRSLILRDTKANLVVDILPGAVP
jgi:hypothetical protein